MTVRTDTRAAGQHSTTHAETTLTDLRTLAPWFAIEFLCSYACTLLTVGCYDYATSDLVKASPSSRLWMSAFWGFCYIFIALGGGKLSEKWGPKRTMVVTIGGSALTALLGIWAIWQPGVWVLIAVMLAYNITCTPIWPAMESAITRTPGKMRLSTRMAGYNLSWGSANFAAFFTRGPLEHWSWSSVFIAPALVSALAWIVIMIFAVRGDTIAADQVPQEAAGERDLDAPAMRQRAAILLKMAWVGNALAYVAINVLIPVLTSLGKLTLNADTPSVGMITAIWGFTRLAGFFITWKWSRWHYRVRWLIGAQIALTLSFCLLLTVHDTTTLVAMQIIFGLATAVIYSSSLYYAMHVSSGHGEHAGMHEALIGVGVMIGPTVGALAGSGELGPPALFRIGLGVTGVLILGILLMAWMSRNVTRTDKLTTNEH